MFHSLQTWWRRRQFPGPRGERIAADFLQKQGYRILARNLNLPQGEIDILAETPDRRLVVIVEVKTRELKDAPGSSGSDALRPEVHVNAAKERKLATLALQLQKRPAYKNRAIRFDVIGIDLPPEGKPVVRHHPAAFTSRW